MASARWCDYDDYDHDNYDLDHDDRPAGRPDTSG